MRSAVACLILLVPITAIAGVDNAVVMVEGCSGVCTPHTPSNELATNHHARLSTAATSHRPGNTLCRL